jgi:hypothetical protein
MWKLVPKRQTYRHNNEPFSVQNGNERLSKVPKEQTHIDNVPQYASTP